MRKKIIIASASTALLFAAIGLILQAIIQFIPRELLEYRNVDKWGADAYAHVASYMTSDRGFDAYAMLRAKSELENAYKTDSIEMLSALYSASSEIPISISSVDSKRSAGCTATVYNGDYFKFHVLPLTEGAYPTDSYTVTDSVLLDELAAWQIFGTGSGVTGMEMRIGDNIYTVSGIAKIPDGVYSEVYGDTPRIYLREDSSATRRSQTKFTVFEAVIPNPITNYAKNAFTKVVETYDATVHDISSRFKGKNLSDMKNGTVKLLTESSDTEYAYTEKAMIILTLKAAGIYSVMKIMYIISIAFTAVLFFSVYGPVVKFIGKLLAKLRF